uniref:Uncharacterized protein n=1 Tax=Panagrolaimus sp. PS1159 TaxID=55785 RepID=A0AC35FX09_9BILA
MLSMAVNDPQARIDEQTNKVQEGVTKAKESANQLADIIEVHINDIIKFVRGTHGSIDTVFNIVNIVAFVVICGCLLFCIISPIIYIIATLIESITKCVRQCKGTDEKVDPNYAKLDERIANIEMNNGIKPPRPTSSAATIDKNQNDATVSAAAANPSVAATASSVAQSAGQSVDAKESTQQKS